MDDMRQMLENALDARRKAKMFDKFMATQTKQKFGEGGPTVWKDPLEETEWERVQRMRKSPDGLSKGGHYRARDTYQHGSLMTASGKGQTKSRHNTSELAPALYK